MSNQAIRTKNGAFIYYLSMFLSAASVVVAYLGVVWRDRVLQTFGTLLVAFDVGLLINELIELQKQEKLVVDEPPVTVTEQEPQLVLALADRVTRVLRLGAGAEVHVNTALNDRCILDVKSASGKNAVGIVLQTDKNIGISAVRGLHSLVINTKTERGFLFTSGTFTAEAVKWAKGKPLFLIDGRALDQMAAKYDAET
jgi:hypothetical protein